MSDRNPRRVEHYAKLHADLVRLTREALALPADSRHERELLAQMYFAMAEGVLLTVMPLNEAQSLLRACVTPPVPSPAPPVPTSVN